MGIFGIKNKPKQVQPVGIPPVSYGKVGNIEMKKNEKGYFFVKKKLFGQKVTEATPEQAQLFMEKVNEEKQAQQ
jgi:hypothetical protein